MTTHVVWDAFTHNGRWGVEIVSGASQCRVGQRTASRPLVRVDTTWQFDNFIAADAAGIRLVDSKATASPPSRSSECKCPRGVSWSVIALLAFGTVWYMQMMRSNNPNLHWIDAISRSVKRAVRWPQRRHVAVLHWDAHDLVA